MVVTRAQVLDLVHRGRSYFQAGHELGVPAGQAYLVATGLPADGSAALTDGDYERPGAIRGSTQALLYLIMLKPPARDAAVDCAEDMWRTNSDAKAAAAKILSKWRPGVLEEGRGERLKQEI